MDNVISFNDYKKNRKTNFQTRPQLVDRKKIELNYNYLSSSFCLERWGQTLMMISHSNSSLSTQAKNLRNEIHTKGLPVNQIHNTDMFKDSIQLIQKYLYF